MADSDDRPTSSTDASAGSTAGSEETAGTDPVDPWAGADDSADPTADDDPGATAPLPPVRTGPAGTSLLPRFADTDPAGPAPTGTPAEIGLHGAGVASAAGVAAAEAASTHPIEEDDSSRWTARAQVPTPGLDDVPEPALAHEEWVEERPPRATLQPVLITLAVLVLLSMIGFGVWLMLQGTDTPTPGPGVDPSATAPSGPLTPAPTTRPAPTTAAATTGPAQPQLVAVPSLRGRTRAQAMLSLRRAGLVGQFVEREDPSVQAGRVISSEPPQGTMVERGFTVQVILSSGPPVPTAPATSEAPETTAPAVTTSP